MNVPVPPTSLKPVSHFLKVAAEHDQRDPIVSYWARFAATQRSLELDKSSPEAKQFLFQLLDWLERRKTELKGTKNPGEDEDHEVLNETVAAAHIEQYALKLFNHAHNLDEKASYNKNIVKSYYTASILVDVLETIVSSEGSLDERLVSIRKFAKWRAAHIHTALKSGVTPDPIDTSSHDLEEHNDPGITSSFSDNTSTSFSQEQYGFVAPGTSNNSATATSSTSGYNEDQQHRLNFPTPSEQHMYNPPPSSTFNPPPANFAPSTHGQSNAAPTLSVEKITQAQKYCKFASSSLNFDDVPTAIVNLRKALHLLETGVELPN